MAVGYGSLRTVRAETQTGGPNITADLRLEDDRIVGTVTNHSNRTLVAPAIAFGASAVTLRDLAPGATADVSLALTANPLNQGSLSDRVIGQVSWDFNGSAMNEVEQRKLVRRSILDQVTSDPMSGWQVSLASDSPVVLAWGQDPIVPMEIEGVHLRRVANVLYQVPVPLRVSGKVTFRNDLLRTSIVESDANFPGALTINFGTSVRLAFRPIASGTFAPAGRGCADVRGRISDTGGQPEFPRRPYASPGQGCTRTGCRTSRCSTSGPGPGSSSSTWRRDGPTSSRTPAGGWTPRAARCRCGSSTSGRTGSGSSSRSRSRE
jgi:hypothetical protein